MALARNRRRACSFCKEETEPYFRETDTLRKFITDRGKIVGRSKTGLCSAHQRHLTTSIKQARYLALLPFISSRG
ncbi:MAG: 30S ribosomal protein S18 [Candidatus Woykebacteria bacterium RIFCSPHIGHO2_12_FULL_45_10]|uniref:Small ribosomal subunit protein bS18 n=1 Tax=Candidatus Woykebacteria bacterium RIFCSPHIGHO2_12_FULL_45_10 TaxID=1802603 RepID=A0A1G1WRI6_9BACT|nr:MAG: 30S ribosomal protein S18 [Candidatus Woykebacteria bacterium RIFCSPHIGHO2_12_FULL_45_10]